MRKLFILALLAPGLWAQSAVVMPASYSKWWEAGLTALPSTSTEIISGTAHLDALYLANTSASAVTVTITDESTNCNAAACQPWPTVSLAANSVYAADMLGVKSVGGVKWSASVANVVHGWMKGKQ